MVNIILLIGLLLVIFSIPLPFQKKILLSTIYPCDFIFILVLSMWSVYAVVTRGIRGLKGNKVLLFFLPFIVAGIISATNAKDFFRFAGYMYIWAEMPLAYIMTVNIIKGKKHLNTLLYSILAAVFLLSLFYIVDYIRQGHYFGIGERETGYYLHHNIIGAYIGMGLPLFLGLIFSKPKPSQRTALAALMVAPLITLLLIVSRWGAVSASFALAIFLFFFVEDKDIFTAKKVSFLILLVFVAVFAYMYFCDRLLYDSTFNLMRDVALGGRTLQYEAALTLFREHPIVGIGAGNFQNLTGYVHTHSIFFQVLAEMGIIGVAGIGYLLWNLTRYITGVVRKASGEYRYIVAGAVVSLIYLFINLILDFTLGHGIPMQAGIILAFISIASEGQS